MPAAVHLASKGRVLVVDDHPVNRRLIELWLSKQGYTVNVAVNGREALDLLGDGHAFKFVLMDCQMPVMDGLAATRELRLRESAASLPRLPVIAITAGGGDLCERECVAAGMDDFLLKPVNFSLLETAMFRLQKGRC
jgi:CheY-like chemotaxis protein